VLGSDYCVRCALQSEVVKALCPDRPLGLVEVEDRHLDAVEADLLQSLEDWHEAVVHLVCPQVEVDAELHLVPLSSPAIGREHCSNAPEGMLLVF
jgi:hypothetical protein